MRNKAEAINNLRNTVKEAFSLGLPVQIGDFEYLYLKKGQHFETEDTIHEALFEGIFQKTPVETLNKETGKLEITGETLLHYGRLDQLDGIIEHLCRSMTTEEIELDMAGAASRSILTEMARGRVRKNHEKESSLSL